MRRLSAELVRLQSEYAGAMGVLARLDSDRSAIPAENHAVRQAMRAMKQWQVDRLYPPAGHYPSRPKENSRLGVPACQPWRR